MTFKFFCVCTSDTAFLRLCVFVCVCLCTWQTFLLGRQTGSGVDRFKVTCPAGTGYFLSPEPFQVQVDKTRFSGSHQKGFKVPSLGYQTGPAKQGGVEACTVTSPVSARLSFNSRCLARTIPRPVCYSGHAKCQPVTVEADCSALSLLPEVTLPSL